MSELLGGEKIRVKVTHVGGPWDGTEESREITKNQTEFVIGQRLASAPAGGKAILHHHYRIRLSGAAVRLVYTGATPADSF